LRSRKAEAEAAAVYDPGDDEDLSTDAFLPDR
jgi:hypothetical protein